MKARTLKILFISTLPLLFAALLFATLTHPPQTAESAGVDGLRVLRSDVNGVLLELDVSAYQLTQRTIASAKFDVLNVAGLELKGEAPGAPQLPMRGVAVAVPQGAEVSVRVLNAQSEAIAQRLNLLPMPTQQLDQSSDPLATQNVSVQYIPNAARYARNAFAPQSPAVLGAVGFMRSQRFAQLSLYPFAYNAAQQSARWIKRLTVEVQFTYPRGQSAQTVGAATDEGAYEKVLHQQIVNYDLARAWRTPARSGASAPSSSSARTSAAETYKLAVNQDGIYRLTYASLTAAGVSPSADPRTFQMKKNGVEFPVYVNGESDGTFDASDYVEFYAQGLNTIYTDTNVYWLTVGAQNGLRMSARKVAPSTAAAQTSFRDRLRVEQNHIFISTRPPDMNHDHWFWNLACSCSGAQVYTFTLQDFDPTLMATLRSNALNWGASYGDPTPHHTQIYLNGKLALDESPIGALMHQAEAAVPASYLLSGTNTISYTLLLTAGASIDFAFVDWFEIDYPHQTVARNDYAPFNADVINSVQLTVTNFSSSNLALYDVSVPTQTVRLTDFGVNGSSGNYTLAFGDDLSRPTKYVAFAVPRSPLSITRYTPLVDLRSASSAADEIIITADDFYTASATLASFRQSQGLRVMRVRVSDIYDQFSDGVFDATAIRSFLTYAYRNWQSPAPLYVLLVGDGWMNYRNYQLSNLGAPKGDFIPPYLDFIDPFVGITATDNRYVNIVGDDIAPDMAIGRLLVRSAAETTAAMNKLIAYEQSPAPGDWRKRVAFYTDNFRKADGSFDSAGDFYAVADGIIAGTIPQVFTVTKVYYDPLASAGDPVYINDGDLDTYLITSTLSAGALFVNYIGHASPWQWADNPTLFGNEGSTFDVFGSVQNGNRTPIVLELTCYTGRFHTGDPESLARSFTISSNVAVADWASTGLGVNVGHDQLARGFYSAVFQDGIATVGLAANASKYNLVANGFFEDLVDEFTLFGDPAMRIQLPLYRTMYLPLMSRQP